jgi:hypothetical protein
MPQPIVSGIALGLLFVTVLVGFRIHHQGYGTGPDGIYEMLVGIGVGLSGCLVSFILGFVSLSRREMAPFLGWLAICLPVLIIVLSMTGTIKL